MLEETETEREEGGGREVMDDREREVPSEVPLKI